MYFTYFTSIKMIIYFIIMILFIWRFLVSSLFSGVVEKSKQSQDISDIDYAEPDYDEVQAEDDKPVSIPLLVDFCDRTCIIYYTAFIYYLFIYYFTWLKLELRAK